MSNLFGTAYFCCFFPQNQNISENIFSLDDQKINTFLPTSHQVGFGWVIFLLSESCLRRSVNRLILRIHEVVYLYMPNYRTVNELLDHC